MSNEKVLIYLNTTRYAWYIVSMLFSAIILDGNKIPKV